MEQTMCESGDEDPGVSMAEEMPQLSESMLTKFTDELRALDALQKALGKEFEHMREGFSSIIISPEAAKFCTQPGRGEHTVAAYIDGIFSKEDDAVRGHILHIDRLLIAIIKLADKHLWCEPETVREVRDKLYLQCKEATGLLCSLFWRWAWGWHKMPSADLITWMFTDRLSKLINHLKRVAIKEVGRKEKTQATMLLAFILGWLKLKELELEHAKTKELIDVMMSIVTLEQPEGYDIHVRQPFDDENMFEPFCKCNESQFQDLLRQGLFVACERDPEIFQYTLAHAMSDPETLISSSSWAFQVLASILHRPRDGHWAKLKKIVDDHVAPRLEDANINVRAKAVWMLNVCIGYKSKHVEDLHKYLMTILNYIHDDESDVLRKQSQICWYKVLILNGSTPILSNMKQALFDNLSEKSRQGSIDLTNGYDIVFRLHKIDRREKPYDFTFKVWLLGAAIMSPQMDKKTDSQTVERELRESIKKIALPAAKKSQSTHRLLYSSFFEFEKNYSPTFMSTHPDRVYLIKSAFKSLLLA